MVNLPLLKEMRKELETDFQEYVRDHPDTFVLFERDGFNIQTTFYLTREELDAATARYKGLIGASFLCSRIPSSTHRDRRDNKRVEFIDDIVLVCPNDGRTELLANDAITGKGSEGNRTYEQQAYCPDCGYIVFRRPSDAEIRQFEENMKIVVRSA